MKIQEYLGLVEQESVILDNALATGDAEDEAAYEAANAALLDARRAVVELLLTELSREELFMEMGRHNGVLYKTGPATPETRRESALYQLYEAAWKRCL